MKSASTALQALLLAAGGDNPLIHWDLITILLTSGTLLTYTTAPFPIYAADNTIWNAPNFGGTGTLWASNLQWTPQVIDDEGNRALGHWKVGLDSDSFQFKIAPRPFDLYSGATFPDQIGSTPWLAAARAGALDGAYVYWDRAYFASVPTHPIPTKGLSPVGTIVMSRGMVGQVDFSTAAAFITVNDFKSLLAHPMPRNVYQSSCRHTLFDARCTLSSGAFTKTGAAGAGSTTSNIIATIAAPGGSNTFLFGTMTMTSGLNNGISRMVSNWDGATNFGLLAPFPYAVSPGDTISVTAGCRKTMADCTAFSNLVNFGASPFVPPPEMSIG